MARYVFLWDKSLRWFSVVIKKMAFDVWYVSLCLINDSLAIIYLYVVCSFRQMEDFEFKSCSSKNNYAHLYMNKTSARAAMGRCEVYKIHTIGLISSRLWCYGLLKLTAKRYLLGKSDWNNSIKNTCKWNNKLLIRKIFRRCFVNFINLSELLMTVT